MSDNSKNRKNTQLLTNQLGKLFNFVHTSRFYWTLVGS